MRNKNTEPTAKTPDSFYTIPELAERWRCSESHVRRMIDEHNVKVLDFAQDGKKGKKLVPSKSVQRLENLLSKPSPR